jgi:hypothetical protein
MLPGGPGGRRCLSLAAARVSSYDALGSYALTPVGTAIAGPLASTFGTTAVLTFGGALVVILPVLAPLVPEVRHMRRR